MIIVDAFGRASRATARRRAEGYASHDQRVHAYLTFGGRELTDEEFMTIAARVTDIIADVLHRPAKDIAEVEFSQFEFGQKILNGANK